MEMTHQEIFDVVSAHLRTMPARSFDSSDGAKACAYRGDNGGKCAVGILIPNNLYSPAMEGGDVSTVLENISLGIFGDKPEMIAFGSMLERNKELLLQMQLIHDDTDNWGAHGFRDCAEKELKECAEHFGLDYPQ